jgi:uncharacterized protein
MPNSLTNRISSLDWDALQQSIDEQGFAKLPPLLEMPFRLCFHT